MNDASGVLALAVRAFLVGPPLTGTEIALLRSYCVQWAAGPRRRRPEVERLRASAPLLNSHRAAAEWLQLAAEAGIDPL